MWGWRGGGGEGEEVETFKMVVLSKTVYFLEVIAGERKKGREGERKKGREGERKKGREGERKKRREGERKKGREGERKKGREGERKKGRKGEIEVKTPACRKLHQTFKKKIK